MSPKPVFERRNRRPSRQTDDAAPVDHLAERTQEQVRKRRRAITFETEKIVIRGNLRAMNCCKWCGKSSPMLTAEEAAILVGFKAETLFRRVEQGRIHSIKTPDGVLM